MYFDYLDVPRQVAKAIKEDIKKPYEDYDVILISRYSDKPIYRDMYIVLAFDRRKKSYVTWMCSAGVGGPGGYVGGMGYGHYDMDFKTALVDFANRLE